jgi:hypothetical protein
MEWGFGLAIVGIIIILIATIWYFATQANTFLALPSLGDNVVKNSSGQTLTRTVTGPNGNSTTVNLTGNNITVKEATQLVYTSPVAIGGWIVGSIMVIGGVIWGVIARSRAKPDSRLAQLLALMTVTTPAAAAGAAAASSPPPRSVSPAPASSGGLTADELLKLRALLGASA